jgi:diadenosine tetraphosphate (Ap4A) HIT family hydrolase
VSTSSPPNPEQPDHCLSCDVVRGIIQSPGGLILGTDLWQLTHAIDPVPVVGWLILQPVRHAESFAKLTDAEAAEFGPLARRASAAVTEALALIKVYMAMFMEARGFAHLHVHLIPRFADMPADRRGPDAFGWMRDAAGAPDRDERLEKASVLARTLAARLQGRPFA